jgi:hypothetical protein
MRRFIILFIVVFLAVVEAQAKVDLVTLPRRAAGDTVQLTIYNAADMTLVREKRALTLKQGINKLQFSWANTFIDPTSLEMLTRGSADKVDILELTFPPRLKNLGLWNIKSSISGQLPMEISYLTSGLSWRAFYIGTLAADEKTMELDGYVRITNNSGEDYENASVRLIVGKVHMLDKIADLARQQYPFGRPDGGPYPGDGEHYAHEARRAFKQAEVPRAGVSGGKPYKDIRKEGLSEYFLYTIEGTEAIPHGWAKRLPSFNVQRIPVKNLYKYDELRFGQAVVRFLSFKNNRAHHLGDTPIPGGSMRVFRSSDSHGRLAYVGQSKFKYIPKNENVELNLGTVPYVTVQITLMNFKTDGYVFDRYRNIAGWDEIREYRVTVRNTRDIPARMEIFRHFKTSCWDIKKKGDFGHYEKEDLNSVKFTLDLGGHTKKTFSYVLTSHHGTKEK